MRSIVAVRLAVPGVALGLVLSCLILVGAAAPRAEVAEGHRMTAQQAPRTAAPSLPLDFIENQGQWPARVEYGGRARRVAVEQQHGNGHRARERDRGPGSDERDLPDPPNAVTASTPVTITASAGGLTRTTTLTVTSPAANVTLTLSASGRSGERVTSSPAGINVAVGGSGSAQFASGTAITLTVSNGRDAIWSGACSSTGSKTKTCTFTINANTSVSADVQ